MGVYVYQHGSSSNGKGAEAALMLHDPRGERQLLPLGRDRASTDDLPFRCNWSRTSRRLDLRPGIGQRGDEARLQPGEEVIFMEWRVRLEDNDSCRRFFEPDPLENRLHAEDLMCLDALLAPCAQRARALARYHEAVDRDQVACFYFRASLDAPNTDVSHYLAALSAFARYDEPALINAILAAARARLGHQRAVEHWARAWRERRKRFHHLTQLQARGELTRLAEETIHQYHLPPFVLIFPAETPAELVAFCRKTLMRAHGQLKDCAPFPDKVTIYLETWRQVGADPACAYYDGQAIHLDRAWFADPTRREEMQATLKHELIHVLTDQVAREAAAPLPRWLDEGIAYHLTRADFGPCPREFSDGELNQILARPGHPEYAGARAAAVARVRARLDEGEQDLRDDGIKRLILAVLSEASDEDARTFS